MVLYTAAGLGWLSDIYIFMGAFFSSYHVYTKQWNGHLRLVLQVNLDFPVFVVGQLYKVFLSLALLIIHSAL